MDIRKVSFSLVSILIILSSAAVLAQPPVEWIRTYDAGRQSEAFCDVYAINDGGYVMCGLSGDHWEARDSTSDMWLVRVDNAGGEIWSNLYGVEDVYDVARSIIETDSGDFLTGGESTGHVAALLVNEDGDQIWFRTYAEGRCSAVIELKSGEFILAGKSGRQGYMACIDYGSNLIWEETYGDDDRNAFYSMRETAGGIVLVGGANPVGPVNYRVWLVKMNFDGELLWERHHAMADYINVGYGIVSCEAGGFALVGYALDRGGGMENPSNDILLMKVDDEGELEWSRRFDLEGAERGTSLARFDEGGFILAGIQIRGNPVAVRVTSHGVVRWQRIYEFRAEDGYGSLPEPTFSSVILNRENSIIAAGKVNCIRDGTGLNGMLIKLEPEILEPFFLYWEPEDTLLEVLLGDEIDFLVRVIDQQEDELNYLWVMGEDTLGSDTTVTVHFEELGEFFVQCQVSDNEFTSAITWHVFVRELYISDSKPDSLEFKVRLNREVLFKIITRAVEGDPVQYIWTLIDLATREDELIGEDDSVTVLFDRPGDFELEAVAYRGDATDAVAWLVHVRSVVWTWWPPQDSLSIALDDIVEFGVEPFNPESDSLSCRWTVDGDSVSGELEVDVAFLDEGTSEVVAYVNDGCEADTLTWTVDMYDPESVERQAGMPVLPREVTLYSPYPNPFNAETTVRFYLPSDADVTLQLYDLKGRLIDELLAGYRTRGEWTQRIDGSRLSTGVYMIRLESCGRVVSQKVIVLK